MSERFKEHDWKSCDAGMYPEVQILFSAPNWTVVMRNRHKQSFFLYFFLSFQKVFGTNLGLKLQFFNFVPLELVRPVRIYLLRDVLSPTLLYVR